jgi:hypothetical protein
MVVFCGHGNNPLGSIKGGRFVHNVSDCSLLKKNSVPWS